MNNKEKQIEILLLTEAIYESGHGLDWGDCKDIAEQLDFLDYRKIPKGSVVLTEERHTALKLIENYHIKSCGKNSVVLTTEELEEIRKQAVKEVLEKTKEKCKELEDKFSHLCKSKKECLMETCRYEGVLAVKRELNEIAKEFGVEL